MAIYEDQLAEIDRDKARGLISEDEARSAQVEIKRRMLAADVGKDGQATSGSGKRALIAAALFVPVAGFGLYSQIGAPETPSVPFADRGEEQQDAQQLQALITELRTRLETDPSGGETRGWELLATTLMNIGRPRQAADAFEQIVEREDASSATWSQYAEALITAENGVVTPLAGRAIARSAELDPTNPAARYYRALEQSQSGRTAEARQSLLDRIAEESAPQPWMPTFLQTANQMGEQIGLDPVEMPALTASDGPRGPSREDVEAAQDMSPEARGAFIRSMVDGLEERLQDEPENLDGWLQLARALLVLGEQDRAFAALQNAEPLVADLPESDQRRGLVEEGLRRFRER